MKVFDASRGELIKTVCEDIFGEDNVNVMFCIDNEPPEVLVRSKEIGDDVHMPCYVYI